MSDFLKVLAIIGVVIVVGFAGFGAYEGAVRLYADEASPDPLTGVRMPVDMAKAMTDWPVERVQTLAHYDGEHLHKLATIVATLPEGQVRKDFQQTLILGLLNSRVKAVRQTADELFTTRRTPMGESELPDFWKWHQRAWHSGADVYGLEQPDVMYTIQKARLAAEVDAANRAKQAAAVAEVK